MEIVNLRPDPHGLGRPLLAIFDVRIGPEIRLFGWGLRLNSEGRPRCYPPQVRGGGCAIELATPLMDAIGQLAIDAYKNGGRSANDDRHTTHAAA